jgi:hypothetical protein
VILAFNLAQPISQLASTVTKNTLGIAMAALLLAFLMTSPGEGGAAGDRLPGDGERSLLRGDQRDLWNADGRRVRRRARRAGRHVGVRHFFFQIRETSTASTSTIMEKLHGPMSGVLLPPRCPCSAGAARAVGIAIGRRDQRGDAASHVVRRGAPARA